MSGSVSVKVCVLLSCICAIGCGRLSTLSLHAPSAADASRTLADVADNYYGADTPARMRAMVDKARQIDPASAVYHELAADLAMLDEDRAGRFTHLYEALRCPDNAVADIHLHEFYEMSWTYEETRRAEDLLTLLAQDHPDPAVRALAAHYNALALHRRGDVDGARRQRDAIGWVLPLAVIGVFDNTQGKGFDVAYPPEEDVQLDGSWPGRIVDVKWRTNPVRGMLDELDLLQLMYPNQSAVAYAAGAVKVTEAGRFELRISTTDGVKVWVNGQVVFAERRIGSWSWDAIVIPVSLNRGVNRIVIKSAHGEGGWDLYARLTGKGGTVPADGTLVSVSPDAPFVAAQADSAALEVEKLVDARVAHLRPGSVRRAVYGLAHATRMGLMSLRSSLAEDLMERFPGSLRGRLELAYALWDAGERGGAADLLAGLQEEAGDDFVILPLKQIRFWWQGDLDRNARELTLELVKSHPDNEAVQMAAVAMYEAEGWLEDQCLALQTMNERWPGQISLESRLADCYGAMGLKARARQMYAEMAVEFPGDYGLMNTAVNQAMEEMNYDRAQAWLEQMIAIWPERGILRHNLADLLRIRGKVDEAKEEWLALRNLSPDAPTAYDRIASMLYFEKEEKEAIRFWHQALERNPDNGALAERMAFLEPKKSGPWEKEIPSQEDLERAVALRDTAAFPPGADSALLLDHCVAELAADGSSINVTTTVQHALNVSGRDAMMEYEVPCPGYARVLHAYAVTKDGRRMEAASIRDRVVRFRQLDVGSTIVVQNRCEQAADELIGDYFSFKWSFQAFSRHFVDSRFILFAPRGVKINEFVRGDVKRTKRKMNDRFDRIEWRAADTPLLKSEVSMPGPSDVAWYLEISTVPDWGLFLKWEDALLQDAFRLSPEVISLARQLTEDKGTPLEKLYAIHAHLVNNIRYQQDYENFIAGVKPHSAQQVIERGYGDCKDKTVLFITLADLAGIEARFALVRTRTFGAIVREVPSQQFNHAIVYVPPQEGIEQGIFFDSTADGLDVDVLRSDDPGTLALVFNRREMTSEWIPIPFQDPSMNLGQEVLSLSLQEDGAAQGSIAFTFKGHLASIFRQTSRNSEKFEKILQIVTDAVVKGAVIESPGQVDIESIEKPVEMTVRLSTKTFSRVKDNEMRFKIPFDAQPEKLFSTDKRDYPLIIGVPNRSQWQMHFQLPAGARVTHLPPVFRIDSSCISFQREVTQEKNMVHVQQTLTYLCERISPEDYPFYRTQVQNLRHALDDDVVLTLKPSK